MKESATKKDWIEDFDKENGLYTCICNLCSSDFIGYKRRFICKECFNKALIK